MSRTIAAQAGRGAISDALISPANDVILPPRIYIPGSGFIRRSVGLRRWIRWQNRTAAYGALALLRIGRRRGSVPARRWDGRAAWRVGSP